VGEVVGTGEPTAALALPLKFTTIAVCGESVQFEHWIVNADVKDPAAEGANSTVTFCEALGASVKVPLPAVTEKGADGETILTVASLFPLLLIVIDFEAAFLTLPNATDLGIPVRCTV
jgi:hypothetical protein